MIPHSLRERFTLGLLAYAVVLSLLILATGTALSERREKTVWRAMLAASLERDARAAGLVGSLPEGLTPVRLVDLDAIDDATVPAVIRRLRPGLYERVTAGGTSYAILVHLIKGHRIAALTDVTSHEATEQRFFLMTLGAMAVGISGLLIVTWWLAGRLVRPVVTLGSQVNALDPGRRGDRILTGFPQHEIVAIESAVNGFLDRLDAFVLREREFIDTVSHELRTPIAVIAGATDVLGDALAGHSIGRNALSRIRTTVGEMDETITALLFLAKDPTAFDVVEPTRLDDLLPAIIADHALLLASKDVTLALIQNEPTAVMVPARIAAIAVGNMLRNAIEHSTAGTVRVALRKGVVAIDNAGAGFDPEAISQRFRDAARTAGARTTGGGIGLYVIRRICERLHWQLDFEPLADGGLRCELDVNASVVSASR